jgi:LysR family transcriptional regulator for metE and metH
LDVRDLEVVLALAASGSTVNAARELHVTQSAVSRSLLVAEEKLGTRLFERLARGLSPTPAGERLIEGATAVLAQLAELEQRASAPPSAPTHVRLVCECYTAYRWLPSTLAQLHRSMSSLKVSLPVEHSAAPVDALLAGEVDIALLTTASVRAPLLESKLFSDEVVFLVAVTHPLAARAAILPADLARYPIIVSTQTPEAEARWFFSRVFGRSKPKLERLRFPLTEAIVDAARAGMGIAILSEWIAAPYLESGDLVVKRLKSGALRRPWRIAFRREAAEPARRLAAALQHAAPRVYAPGIEALSGHSGGRQAADATAGRRRRHE